MLSLLRRRRSIRFYQEKAVDPACVNDLVECILRSPSSRNFRPWEFIIVTDKSLLEALSKSKQHGSSFLARAPLGIVVCAREEVSDVWVEDCSIASTAVQFSAESMGLGACWIQIRNRMHDENTTAEEYIKKHLSIPEPIRVESIIAVGHPAENKDPHPTESLLHKKVHMNYFDHPYSADKKK